LPLYEFVIVFGKDKQIRADVRRLQTHSTRRAIITLSL